MTLTFGPGSSRIVFGEADPKDYMTEAAPVQIALVRPVALRASLDVRLVRYARSRCDSCQKRRVRYAIAVDHAVVTGYLCARCAGVR